MKFLLPLLLLLSAFPAFGQLSVAMQINRSQYVKGEAVMATVTITNRSGRELFLRSAVQGDITVSWLDFKIRDSRGRVVSRATDAVFRAAQVAPGQSVARQINLGNMFNVGRADSYSVTATVREGGLEDARIYSSNSARFSVSDGRVLFEQPFGAPGTAAPERAYRVSAFNDGERTSIYASVMDEKRGASLTTFRLSEALLFRAPEATLDSKNQLHVLYLANPTIFVHATVSQDGEMVNTGYFQRGAASVPRLAAFANGEIKVVGGVPFDPVAAEKARNEARKITDRP